MAVRHQVTRISANPRRRARRARNRKMTPEQVKYFGTKRQRAALKNSRRRKRAANAKKRTSHRRRSINPAAWVVTLGSPNPHRKRSKPVAKARKRRNRRAAPRRVSHRRRRHTANPRHRRRSTMRNAPRRRRRRHVASNVRHHRRRTRRMNPVARRRRRRSNPRRVYYINRRHRRRSNPSLFGTSLTSREGLKILGGGFVGLIGAKFLPTLIPASMAGSFMTTSIGRIVVTGVAGWLAAMIAGKIFGPKFGDGALFGALIQTGSVALNTLVPSLYAQLGIGLGDFVPGRFSVPQNPLMQRAQMMRALPPGSGPASSVMPTGAQTVSSGLGRAYPAAY